MRVLTQSRPSPPQSADFRRLLRSSSLEMSARDPGAVAACAAGLEPGASIFLNFGPRDTWSGVAAAAATIRRAGFNPVPHLAARYFQGRTELANFLVRAQGEAGVEEALLVGGDVDRPAGPYASSLALLETGLLERHGIRRIAIAGYPEPHPRISATAIAEALSGKLARAAAAGIAASIVTQFCFEPQPIGRWLGELRRQGIAVPVRIGLAGPAGIASLTRFALRCGIGPSLRALARANTARLLFEVGPEPIIATLASPDHEDLCIAGLHFFTFGGVARTVAWRAAILADQP
jgi:methylenetetrahydrofolate reductase (NADPH)